MVHPRLLLVVCSVWAVSLPALSRLRAADGYVAIRGARIETVGKAGTIEDGVLLVRDGRIEAVGSDVKIPVSAKIIDASGMTLMPGIVDPYFVVEVGRNAQASSTRTVVVRGRTFVVGGGSPAVATTFAKIADGIDVNDIDWAPARRSGITTLHLTTGGYAQSVFAETTADAARLTERDGALLVTVANETKSLDVLRNGLKAAGNSRGGASGSAGSGGRPGGGRPTSGNPSDGRGAPGSGATAAPASSGSSGSSDPSSQLWNAVREGKSYVFVNVNNAAAILHALVPINASRQTKTAFIADGEDVYRVLEELNPKTQAVIIAPGIDTIPNSQVRINVPKLLADRHITFAFSPSLGQSNFQAQQDTPLFAVAMLVRSGLERKLALQALTETPAKLLGIEAEVGTLEAGKKANFIVLDGDPFATTTSVRQVFIEGEAVHER